MTLSGVLPHVLFWLPVAVLLSIAAVFLWRRIWLEFPLFFLYILSAPLIGLLRYMVFPLSRSVYFYVYWISELAAALIFSLAIYELFLRRLFPRFYQVRLYRRLFPVTALLILLGTIVAVLESHDRSAAFQVASRAFDFARTAALVFFMLLMSFMGRHWTRYEFGIALGFGMQAAAALANAAMRARLGHRSSTFDTAETIAFELACLVWLLTFMKAEAADHPGTSVPLSPKVMQDARKWESVLKHWLTPGK